MYQNFFGFKERPFQLVPNPAYLFLSPSHEEAMAHLTYATAQGDGFVVLTGEVGTGKTTLCRAFIESLDEQTEVAYIFNPKLTAIELLQTICDEFDIKTPANTTKALIDALNAFLMEKKSQGKRVLLIIDEAQNLDHNVLEQVRLLSNIETNTEKLLQIILVGQPEMANLLDSYELRQLGQRITLSCHISPLTYRETCRYIQHRIRIAARNEGIPFTKAAFKRIYAYSIGIPRLIHIVCDRALLIAYGLDQYKITGNIVHAAIQELTLRGDIRKLRFLERKKTILLSVLLSVAVVSLFVFKPKTIDMKHALETVMDEQAAEPEENAPAQKAMETETAPKATGLSSAPSPTPGFPSLYGREDAALVEVLSSLGTHASMENAIIQVLSLWEPADQVKLYDKKRIVDDETFFRLTAKENGFLIEKIEGDFELIQKLDMPAMIGFTIPGNMRPKYLALGAVQDDKLIFLTDDPNRRIEIPLEQMMQIWSGTAYVPWKNFFDYRGTTPISGPAESIGILKKMLQNIGYSALDNANKYDATTKAAVKEIQSAHGLTADGFVGPLTKIILYRKQPDLAIPHLASRSPNRFDKEL